MSVNKKLKFGNYRISASLDYEDTLDLEHHHDKVDWEEMSPKDQINWIESYIEEMALAEIDFSYEIDD